MKMPRKQVKGPVPEFSGVGPADPIPGECQWRIVEGYPSYEVSEFGHVRRAVPGSNTKKGKVLRPRWNGRYYDYSLSRDSCERTLLAHGLVCRAFHGEKPSPGMHAAHWDGCPVNCHFSNLRWATPRENAADKHRHGRTMKGDRHTSRTQAAVRPKGTDYANAKLDDEAVRYIRASPAGLRELCDRFGVAQSLIVRVRAKKSWKHVL